MMIIRPATPADAPAISRLVLPLAAKFITVDFAEDAARRLLATMEPTAIGDYIAAGLRYHVAEEDGAVLGVVAVRDNRHLYHLFVAEARQRQGLATELWHVAREACIAAGNAGEFTVNSSRFAVPFYRKLGFVEAGAPVVREGITAIPMRLQRNVARTSDHGQ